MDAANQIFENHETSLPHPTKATPGEELPAGFAQSYASFLICNHQREIEIDQDIVKQEMEYLRQYVAIVCVIGGSPVMSTISGWIVQV
jgi:hypothetical protein